MRRRTRVKLPKGTKVPNHIALILDGNRRWARARGLPVSKAHPEGYKAVVKLAEEARELGVHTFTIWAFSTENWKRSKSEVGNILRLLKKGLKEFEVDAHKKRVRLIHLGRKDRFPRAIANQIAKIEESTAHYKDHVLNLALDYGGKDEIIRATRQIVKDKIPAEKIDEKLFETYLDTRDQPYPYVDLFIRTSGEQRTSGLMPWQLDYAEYYFEEAHLPDFTPTKLREAILDYSRRRRRFGGNDAVEHLGFKPELVASLELAWWRLENIPEGTRFRDYALQHVREQYGMSKSLAKEAAKYLVAGVLLGKKSHWAKARVSMKKFYALVRDEMKLAFEPELAATLKVKLWKDSRNFIEANGELEDTAKLLYAEVYRISMFQAAKLAHLRVMARVEKQMAERGMGEYHWDRAEDYLQRFYCALKERVA